MTTIYMYQDDHYDLNSFFFIYRALIEYQTNLDNFVHHFFMSNFITN